MLMSSELRLSIIIMKTSTIKIILQKGNNNKAICIFVKKILVQKHFNKAI